jgi:RNA-directed DNA polymerase
MRQKTRRTQASAQLAFDLGPSGEFRSRPGEGLEACSPPSDVGALAPGLMEAVVAADNMRQALKRVRANKGSPGVDGMTVDELAGYLQGAWPQVRRSLLEGTYRPQPVKRVDIPKPGGGTRQLGVPTVLDRLLQQAVLQVLSPLYEPTFSAHSYGFRPGRSAHEAVEAARGHVASGKKWVVDLDLEKFFDRVSHDVLMGLVRRRIKDRRVLRLIRRYLQAGVMLDGVVTERHEGTPQGGPLSPLLANIMLHDLDHELERRGHCLCRYADDCNIYVGSRRAGLRMMDWVTQFVERKLRLKVNRDKSAVARPWQRKFLGYRIIIQREVGLTIAPESLERAKHKVRQLTRRSRGVSVERMLRELRTFTDGWVTYFRYASASPFKNLDRWIRRRVRCYVWKQWKKPRKRARELIRAGVGRYAAWGMVYDGPGLWRAAGSPPLTKALSNVRLAELGYHSLLKRYEALAAA